MTTELCQKIILKHALYCKKYKCIHTAATWDDLGKLCNCVCKLLRKVKTKYVWQASEDFDEYPPSPEIMDILRGSRWLPR